MCSLLVLAVLAQPAVELSQPIQAAARIDGAGNLIISVVSEAGPGFAGPVEFPGKAKVKVKVLSVFVTTTELPAKSVEAYTVDGRLVTAERLTELLAKERTVLVALDGKKVDPFLLQLYKEGTILLVPPANTVQFEPGGAIGGHNHPVDPSTPVPEERILPPRRIPDRP